MKYWDFMSAINIWDNVHKYFNIKYMANNKQKKKKPHGKQFKIARHLQIYFRIQRMHSRKTSLTIICNKLKLKYLLIVFSLLLS